ncbi:hypothetical protein ACMBCN_01370, partial [Candidatus Liberibacter asiaticus]|nr:hypothetical protein [Candidatus Liberibacter asiaticus]
NVISLLHFFTPFNEMSYTSFKWRLQVTMEKYLKRNTLIRKENHSNRLQRIFPSTMVINSSSFFPSSLF